MALRAGPGEGTGAPMPLNTGKISPAWDSDKFVCVNGRYTTPVCCETDKIEEYLKNGDPKKRPDSVWVANALKGSDTVALAVVRNAVLAVCETPRPRDLKSRWIVSCLNPKDGSVVWQQELSSPALPNGFLIDRDGRVIVAMENGTVACFGGARAIGAYIEAVEGIATNSSNGKQKAIDLLSEALKAAHDPDAHGLLVSALEKLGVNPDDAAKKKAA
jgi:hypothetical protein